MTNSTPSAPSGMPFSFPAFLKKRGWRWKLFLALVIPLFLCGASLLVYVLFPPAPINILVMGLDSRQGEGALARTDTVMVVGVRPYQLRVSVLSLPRDLFIDTPGYGSQRINTINLLGEQDAQGSGSALLAQAILQTFAVPIQRTVRLEFQGFVELIDAVGGVTIDVERAIVDDAYPTEDGGIKRVEFASGVQYMDGEQALIYSRVRHGSDDYQRAQHQQQVLSALIGQLSNPARWPAALAVLNRNLETDLSFFDLAQMAPPILLSGGRFERLVIDRDYIKGTAAGHAIPDLEKLQSWLADHLQ